MFYEFPENKMSNTLSRSAVKQLIQPFPERLKLILCWVRRLIYLTVEVVKATI
jgi:hypothetical protein